MSIPWLNSRSEPNSMASGIEFLARPAEFATSISRKADGSEPLATTQIPHGLKLRRGDRWFGRQRLQLAWERIAALLYCVTFWVLVTQACLRWAQG